MSTRLTAMLTPPTIPADMATAALRGEAARLAILQMVDTLAQFGISPSITDVSTALHMARASVRWHVKVLREANILEPAGPLRRPPAAN